MNTKLPDNTNPLSIAISTFGDEPFLQTTLESVCRLADEIVIVGENFQNEIQELAKVHHATLIQAAENSRRSARINQALAVCTGDWILVLEPGETLEPEVVQQLREFVVDFALKEKTYLFFVARPQTTPGESSEQVGQIRLIPNHQGLQFSGLMGETVFPSVLENNLEVDALSCRIARKYSQAYAIWKHDQWREDLIRIESLPTEIALTPTVRLAQAQAHAALGTLVTAKEIYLLLLQQTEKGSSEQLEAYYGLLTLLEQLGDAVEEQISVCVEALEIFPFDTQLLCGMGSYLLKHQRLDLAMRSYQLATTHGTVDPLVWHLPDATEIACNCWALCHQLQNQTTEAIEVIQMYLQENPNSIRLRRQLIDMYIKTENIEAACGECEALDAQEKNQFPMNTATVRTMLEGCMRAAVGQWEGAIAKLKPLTDTGLFNSLACRWLVTAYLGLNKLDQAQQVLILWKDAVPYDTEWSATDLAVQQHIKEMLHLNNKKWAANARIDNGRDMTVETTTQKNRNKDKNPSPQK